MSRIDEQLEQSLKDAEITANMLYVRNASLALAKAVAERGDHTASWNDERYEGFSEGNVRRRITVSVQDGFRQVTIELNRHWNEEVKFVIEVTAEKGKNPRMLMLAEDGSYLKGNDRAYPLRNARELLEWGAVRAR